MKPLKEKVSITLDSDIIQAIKELAENDEMLQKGVFFTVISTSPH